MNPKQTIKSFHANAKLMITGEYLVLRGAHSLSVPLKFGQTLQLTEHPGIPAIGWTTYVKEHHWFDAD
jgi:hypothetical protein